MNEQIKEVVEETGMERNAKSSEVVRDIFEEVIEILDNYHNVSYHVFCSIGNENWSNDYSSVSFTVNFWNDQGEGSEWKESWSIDKDGKIYTREEVYQSLNEFRARW